MKRSLNLMSEHALKQRQVRSCLRIWSRIVILAILVLTAGGLFQWKRCHNKQIQREFLEAEYQPIRQLKIENGRLRKQIDSIEEGEQIPLELAKHQPLLSLIGLATQAVAEQQGSLFLTRLEIERDPLSMLSSRQTNGQSNLTYVLNGISTSNTAVTQLANSLREKGPFDVVAQDNNQSPQTGKQTRQVFSIQCTN